MKAYTKRVLPTDFLLSEIVSKFVTSAILAASNFSLSENAWENWIIYECPNKIEYVGKL